MTEAIGSDIKYLEPGKAQFSTSAGGLVQLVIDDTTYNKVDLHLAFPFSLPRQFISVRDSKGKEIGMIRHVEELDKTSRQAIEQELQWRYFSPVIQRILSLKEEFGHTYWEVETDRGLRKFVTRGRDEGVQRISETRLLIIDMTGNRFDIPDTEQLDPKSRSILESVA